ncbi:iron dicitrate transport regulator FecR [Sphingobium sp. Leaf26]|uniref:FecR family protein n=1 Tax=Sphingobium sp. Leaf26 TaxID=1735693 RepID=UPI0006F35FFE|nr:FecR domain-containing protein [Sphingobium sp. Leaf26]KQN01030.1 iron dicitrate transport regulator FecR [Sphingobium sp. Leaf26]
MPGSIEDMAARWAVRHPLDPDQHAALDAWLALDPRHAGALLRAQAALSCVDDALVADADQPSKAPFWTRRKWLAAGLGGSMAAVLAGGLGLSRWMGQHVATERGEIRRLPLGDGSVATIDSDSDLHVALGDEARRITLAKGQAWFQVAKDSRRPFIVDAGLAQARAIGTAFSVSRTDKGVQIAVTEGTVATWAKDGGGSMTILKAGDFATFEGGALVPVTGNAPQAIERALAWRMGEIALEGDTLRDAVVRFNRYNAQQLVIVDESLANEKLIGLFRIDNPAGFARTLAASLDVTVTVTPDAIRLSRKKIDTI